MDTRGGRRNRQRHSRRPSAKADLLGHFIVGTQLALQLALDHPDVVGGIVIIGGEPMRYTPSRKDATGKTPMSKEERVAGIDAIMGPRWFKTVTLETWNSNNFVPGFYSRDSVLAARVWQRSADVPMPIMIRYLCSYWSMDLDHEWSQLDV